MATQPGVFSCIWFDCFLLFFFPFARLMIFIPFSILPSIFPAHLIMR